ncbi:MAG TPA: hypothetical protein VKU00_30140 [Chthonomonadaceae bacterium]|nr:hypothetical protein [Chthonomonadaceae bacterium]
MDVFEALFPHLNDLGGLNGRKHCKDVRHKRQQCLHTLIRHDDNDDCQ